jgi:hypothetical protein
MSNYTKLLEGKEREDYISKRSARFKLDKMMKSKKYKANIKKYILERIDVTEGDKKYKFPDKENSKILYVFERFKSEYLHENIFRYHREDVKKVMAEWLSGLALNFDYYYYDIIEESKKLHEVESFDEDTEELIKENWFQHLANELFYLLDQQ